VVLGFSDEMRQEWVIHSVDVTHVLVAVLPFDYYTNSRRFECPGISTIVCGSTFLRGGK
jgi:hypothetical protein